MGIPEENQDKVAASPAIDAQLTGGGDAGRQTDQTAAAGSNIPAVLDVKSLRKHFSVRSAANPLQSTTIPAVDGVSFTLGTASTTAVVGESGSGKSTLARLVLHLYKPDAGEMYLLGRPVHDLSSRQFRPYRRHVQMVFQNPWMSFDPKYSLGTSIREVLRLRPDGRADSAQSVAELLDEVGLSPRFAERRPQGLSGGELQRAAVARALAARSELVVLDEPTSALDKSIQGQVLALLQSLQENRHLSYLIATHDLGVVRLLAHEVLVMYLGELVEVAPTAELFSHPAHPYTLGLLGAEHARPSDAGQVRIKGSLHYPEPGYQGCRLVGRCPLAMERCREKQPLAELEKDHLVRCWRAIAGDTSTGPAQRSRQRVAVPTKG